MFYSLSQMKNEGVMVRILKQIADSVASIFLKIIDLEGKRVDEFNRHFFENEERKGGEK